MPLKRDSSTTSIDANTSASSNYDSNSSDDEFHMFKIKSKELSIFSGNLLASISAKE
jgi:hypothetical protein